MWNQFKHRCKLWIDRYENLKGQRTLHHVHTYRDASAFYEIQTNAEFTITIHCVEHVYECRYANAFFKPRQFSIFHVYSVCGAGTPPPLQLRLETELRISSIVSLYASREYKKKAAIQAYVDLVIRQMQTSEPAG